MSLCLEEQVHNKSLLFRAIDEFKGQDVPPEHLTFLQNQLDYDINVAESVKRLCVDRAGELVKKGKHPLYNEKVVFIKLARVYQERLLNMKPCSSV